MSTLARLSPRDRRAIVFGGIALGVALLFRMAVRPYLHARAALAERVREQEGLLMKELALAQSASAATNDLSIAVGRLDADRPLLLDARDPIGATASLVGAMGDDARRHGVLVEAIESRPPMPLGDHLTAVQVDVRGRGDLEGLLSWLYGMEQGGHLWRVEQISFARLDGAMPPDSADTETLAFAMSIRGFTLASPSASSRLATASLGVAP